ncbi:hypothetical protein EWM64_g930 [Hericium alpestre]|uniref:Uncharacterized protein n=1 Tax=Hericium alpestre TaxID=135208 RepID=A0A4Z0A972_9AGAM|nr:hypothetical protein EWM64_g6120 [Hericium alpestre]TFY83090.1 hypothetical protein EWM64_g930 [Hericium alpestre]
MQLPSSIFFVLASQSVFVAASASNKLISRENALAARNAEWMSWSHLSL